MVAGARRRRSEAVREGSQACDRDHEKNVPVRRLAPLVAVLGLVALPLAARAATTHDVTVADDSFAPAQLSVDSGDTVRWTNKGLRTHSVTFSGETREETTLLPGQTRTTTFEKAGTYRYRCGFHPETMQGSIVVRASTSSSTTSTTRATTTSTTQDPRGSAITAPPDPTTTTSTSTTTTVVEDTTTTTLSTLPGDDSALGDPGEGDADDVDGPSAVAAALLLATAGGAFTVARRALP